MAYRYRKAGVVLSELRPVGTEQGALFTEAGAASVPDPAWTESWRRWTGRTGGSGSGR